jgi:hypothetical protein
MKKYIVLSIALLLLPFGFLRGQGCMETETEQGISVIGYIQPQFEYQLNGDDLSGNNLDINSFYFNRARLGVTGSIPYDFSYYVMTELSPTKNGPYILDGFLTYNRLGPWAKISVGQFRSPFGLELTTPCHKLHTINRSLVVDQLSGPFRDLGLMVSGGTDSLSIFGSKTKNLIGYQVGIMNGTGMNVWDNNGKKDIVGRITLHPFEFLTIGGSYRYGKHPAVAKDATKDDERSRIGAELEFHHKGIRIQGEYIRGTDKGSYTTGGGCGGDLEVHEGSVNRSGFFVQAMYMTPWKLEPVIKFETYDPNMDEAMINDIQNTTTFGLNYFFNDWIRFQINYLYKAEESGVVEVPNDVILIQGQVLF